MGMFQQLMQGVPDNLPDQKGRYANERPKQASLHCRALHTAAHRLPKTESAHSHETPTRPHAHRRADSCDPVPHRVLTNPEVFGNLLVGIAFLNRRKDL